MFARFVHESNLINNILTYLTFIRDIGRIAPVR